MPRRDDPIHVAAVLRRFADAATGDDRACLLFAADHFDPTAAATLPPADPNATLPPLAEPTTLPPSSAGDSPGKLPHGFDLLGELGRGGMGVVYKARQRGLNRIVALKTILVGGHAGEAHLARFRAEAEAVARLKHPNVVQVYEVGEMDGLPFFALEFVDGGSLAAKIDGKPWDGRDAARLMEQVARAVHATHGVGIVHRDLKPGNILLTGDGQPKVADFGLAKQLETEGATRTGEVMGTPEYMAPEQAEGRKDVGPAADVYALGAILYELLTGRTPFRGATPLDTILMTLEQEPVPVRTLNPAVGRDLEVVCEKCLRKLPAARYVSASDLADDLRRFADGEPILARPLGLYARLKRKAKTLPTMAWVALLMIAMAAGFSPMVQGNVLTIPLFAVSLVLGLRAAIRPALVAAAGVVTLSVGGCTAIIANAVNSTDGEGDGFDRAARAFDGIDVAHGQLPIVAIVLCALVGQFWRERWLVRFVLIVAVALYGLALAPSTTADGVRTALDGVPFGVMIPGLLIAAIARWAAHRHGGSPSVCLIGALGGMMAYFLACGLPALALAGNTGSELVALLGMIPIPVALYGGAYLACPRGDGRVRA